MTVREFRLPKLGMAMQEGLIVEWLVKEGDVVAEGQAIVVVATDKVDSDLPSPFDGTVLAVIVPAETSVPVGTLLATIMDAAN